LRLRIGEGGNIEAEGGMEPLSASSAGGVNYGSYITGIWVKRKGQGKLFYP